MRAIGRVALSFPPKNLPSRLPAAIVAGSVRNVGRLSIASRRAFSVCKSSSCVCRDLILCEPLRQRRPTHCGQCFYLQQMFLVSLLGRA